VGRADSRFSEHGVSNSKRDDSGQAIAADSAGNVWRIPLRIEPGAQPLKSFSVILTNPRGGATLGAQSTTEVRITDTR
jgi:hypothetical protein